MQRESGNGQDIPEVSGGILRIKRMPLISREHSSLVIHNLCDHAKKENIAVAFLYCDNLSQQEQTVTNMIGAILKQLVGRGEILNYLHELFKEGKKEIDDTGMRPPNRL